MTTKRATFRWTLDDGQEHDIAMPDTSTLEVLEAEIRARRLREAKATLPEDRTAVLAVIETEVTFGDVIAFSGTATGGRLMVIECVRAGATSTMTHEEAAALVTSPDTFGDILKLLRYKTPPTPGSAEANRAAKQRGTADPTPASGDAA
jgi:hypothetical protein